MKKWTEYRWNARWKKWQNIDGEQQNTGGKHDSENERTTHAQLSPSIYGYPVQMENRISGPCLPAAISNEEYADPL
jgi:hypothetical protein